MRTYTFSRSSWINSIGYFTGPDGVKWLALFTTAGPDVAHEHAILIRDSPAYLKGLLLASRAKEKTGDRSIGATYNKVVKGKFQSQTVTDENEIKMLKELCK